MRTCPTGQRVKADHPPSARLPFLLPVPPQRGGCIQDFLQVHIDLLTGRAWLAPTVRNATAETAARNLVGSVLRDAGRPDVLVSDRDALLTGAFWHFCSQRWVRRSHLRLATPSQHHKQGRARLIVV